MSSKHSETNGQPIGNRLQARSDSHDARVVSREHNNGSRTKVDARLGELLHSWRVGHVPAFSQRKLARELDCSPTLINLVESGQRGISRQMAERIINTLNPPPREVREFLHAAGVVTISPLEHLAPVLDAIMDDDSGNTILRELARADLSTSMEAWQRLVQSVGRMRQYHAEETLQTLNDLAHNRLVSPILRLYAQRKLGEVYRLLGRLKDADSVLAQAIPTDEDGTSDYAVLRQSAPEHGLLLEATIRAQQAEVALERRTFGDARQHLQESQASYSAITNIQAPHIDDIARLGLSLSALRSATVCMHEGNDKRASAHCTEAWSYLADMPTSAQKRDMERRTIELEAWILARERHFAEAMAKHIIARNMAKRDGNWASELSNTVYIGHDWLHLIDDAVESMFRTRVLPSGIPQKLSPGEAWQLVITQSPDSQFWQHELDREFRRALEMQHERRHPTKYVHSLIGMAQAMRLGGDRHTAVTALIQAERFEDATGPRLFMPIIFETRGDLYWDLTMTDLARRWYVAALRELRQMQQGRTLADEIIKKHYERIEQKIHRLEFFYGMQVVREEQEAKGPAPQRQTRQHQMNAVGQTWSANAIPSSHSDDRTRAAADHAWFENVYELRDYVISTIKRMKQNPIATSDTDPHWLQQLADFEALPGGRVLAQSELSGSLATEVPVYLMRAQPSEPRKVMTADSDFDPDRAEDAFHRRRETFIQNVKRAHAEFVPTHINQDLCSGVHIEAHIDEANAIGRVREALRLMTERANGYVLYIAPTELPLGFAVKQTRVLLEIPMRLARTAHLVFSDKETQVMLPMHQRLCYRFDNKMFANELRLLFSMLRDDLDRRLYEKSMLDWLRELVLEGASTARIDSRGQL